MKTLFESPSRLVKYALTMVAFFIALGIIFASVFGFNGSTEYNGYYEISIDCFDSETEQDIDSTVNKVLSEHNYSVSEKLVENRDYCETLVYRYHSNSTQNATKIQEQLVSSLNLNEGMVTVQKLTNAHNGITVWNYILAIGVLLVVVFLVSLVRYGLKHSLSLTASLTITSLLSMAVIAFTRIVLSKSLIIMSLVSAIVSVIITMSILNRTNINKENSKNISYKDAYLEGIKAVNTLDKIIISCALIIAPSALLLTFNGNLVMLGLGYLVCAFVCAFVSIILAPAIYILLEDKQEEKTKKIVSRNTKNK